MKKPFATQRTTHVGFHLSVSCHSLLRAAQPRPVMEENWYTISNAATIPSPALVVYPERIRENIRRALQIIGDPKRLRPHIKTHKCSRIIRLHLDLGITKFKCATIAEAEMAATAGAKDVLIAAQLIGPNVQRFADLRVTFPETLFSTIFDNLETAHALSQIGRMPGEISSIPVYLDLNCGMGRTGTEPDEAAFKTYERVCMWMPSLEAVGLHAYDGHIHDADLASREAQCEQAMAPVLALRDRLVRSGLPVPGLVAGGTPTFSIHARHPDRECSPGTYVFWDFGYQKFTDLDFYLAALVLTRVSSKPASNRLCLDLGHKAIAAENPPPRVQFLNLPNATAVMHSEEHLVIETPEASEWNVGDILYGVPRHICPTVALHDFCFPIENGAANEPWLIEARRRKIEF